MASSEVLESEVPLKRVDDWLKADERSGIQSPSSPRRMSALVEESQRGPNPPPTDGGFYAWLFVASGLMLECLLWGFAFR